MRTCCLSICQAQCRKVSIAAEEESKKESEPAALPVGGPYRAQGSGQGSDGASPASSPVDGRESPVSIPSDPLAPLAPQPPPPPVEADRTGFLDCDTRLSPGSWAAATTAAGAAIKGQQPVRSPMPMPLPLPILPSFWTRIRIADFTLMISNHSLPLTFSPLSLVSRGSRHG